MNKKIRSLPSKNSKETSILRIAADHFLKYGYHGTSLSEVAKKAGINKSTIHYYFRSKKNLYREVIETVVGLLVRTSFEINSDSKGFGRFRWFLITEQYNNKLLFEKTLKDAYPLDYQKKLELVNEWLNSPSNMQDYIS